MTADQLEPLVSQTLVVADRHTAQLKQLVNLVIQQSDNIQFVLKELEVAKGRQVAADAKIEAVDAKIDRILDLLGGGK